MENQSRICIAGSDTLLGPALVRQLQQQGFTQIIQQPPENHNPVAVDRFFRESAPEFVFLTGGRSGGIAANQKYPAELMLDNLLIETSVIDACHRHGVKKLLFLASSCIYPKHAPQPMHPNSLMTGLLEPTNEAYALAKLAGLKMCEAYRKQYNASFITAIPANPFGLGDDFSEEESHVISALIRRMHEAKMSGNAFVEIWGTGSPRREFIFADDLADACIFVMQHYDKPEPLNIGSGEELSIRELALVIQEVVGYSGEIRFDTSRSDGMPIKVLDSTPLRDLGWQPKGSLKAGLEATYQWYLEALEEGTILHA